MISVVEINAEMARISQPIDLDNDEFTKLFEDRKNINCEADSLLLEAEKKNENAVQPLITSNSMALNVMHVSMASIVAIIAFFGGLRLSGVGHDQTVDRAENLETVGLRNFRVIPKYKRTVIVQSDKASSTVFSVKIPKPELPKAISVPLTSIVAAAYGVNKKRAEEDYLLPIKAHQPPQQKAFSARCGQPYQVKEGQTLAMVSQEIFGTTDRWRQLFYVNRHMIGRSPSFLVVGQVLKVPCRVIKVPKKLKYRIGKSRVKKTRAKSTRKRYTTKLRVKRSLGNRLITITKVRRSK